MEACPPKSSRPHSANIADVDDIFDLGEGEATFVCLPRLGLGGTYAVFSDGSYAYDWSPKL